MKKIIALACSFSLVASWMPVSAISKTVPAEAVTDFKLETAAPSVLKEKAGPYFIFEEAADEPQAAVTSEAETDENSVLNDSIEDSGNSVLTDQNNGNSKNPEVSPDGLNAEKYAMLQELEALLLKLDQSPVDFSAEVNAVPAAEANTQAAEQLESLNEQKSDLESRISRINERLTVIDQLLLEIEQSKAKKSDSADHQIENVIEQPDADLSQPDSSEISEVNPDVDMHETDQIDESDQTENAVGPCFEDLDDSVEKQVTESVLPAQDVESFESGSAIIDGGFESDALVLEDEKASLAEEKNGLEAQILSIDAKIAEVHNAIDLSNAVKPEDVKIGGNTPNWHECKEQLAQLKDEIESLTTSDVLDDEQSAGLAEARKKAQDLENTLKGMEFIEMYRLYNPNSGEHFYTGTAEEKNTLIKAGWRYEGVGWKAPKNTGSSVYRLYNPVAGDHHFTLSSKERDNLIKAGWRYEGIGWKSDPYLGAPLYRQYNPNAWTGAHNFTLSSSENDMLQSVGWRAEGIGWYGVFLESVCTLINSDGTSYVVVYGPDDQKLYGSASVSGNQFYLDPNADGAMKKGLIDLDSKSGASRSTKAFGNDGHLITGEASVDGKKRYFDYTTGIMYRSKWRWDGANNCTYYYDINGIKASGPLTIQGKKYTFDPNTGALKRDVKAITNVIVTYINQNKLPGDQIAFALDLVDGTGSSLWNSKAQQSASSMKMFVMGAIYENYSTYCARFGKSVIDYNLSSMITWSSNDAWAYLVSVLGNGNYSSGLGVLRSWCRSKGYNDTQMMGYAYGNFTSARDCNRILVDIETGKLKNSSAMKSLLKQQAVPGRLLAGIPAGVVTGNKAGWLDNTQNDSVLVYASKGTYVISMLATNLKNISHTQAMMKAISASVYNYLQN